jgi:hypothetical protein
MTQVLQHDYGKSRVSLLEIRAAIKAVKAAKAVADAPVEKSPLKPVKRTLAAPSRKGA